MYLIPQNIDILDPKSFKWEKSENKYGIINGWKTGNYKGCDMKICFSMSSQLWITIDKEQIKKYKVGEKILI